MEIEINENGSSEGLTVVVVKLNENGQMSVSVKYQVKVSPKWEWVEPLTLRTSANVAPEPSGCLSFTARFRTAAPPAGFNTTDCFVFSPPLDPCAVRAKFA